MQTEYLCYNNNMSKSHRLEDRSLKNNIFIASLVFLNIFIQIYSLIMYTITFQPYNQSKFFDFLSWLLGSNTIHGIGGVLGFLIWIFILIFILKWNRGALVAYLILLYFILVSSVFGIFGPPNNNPQSVNWAFPLWIPVYMQAIHLFLWMLALINKWNLFKK